jgi:archaellum component FlaC
MTGKSFKELSEGGASLSDILAILMKRAQGNTDRFAAMFGNVNAKAAALSLLQGGTEEYNEALAKMTKSEGSAEKAYEKMADTAEHKLQIIKTNIENTGISIGNELLPEVENLLEKFEDNLPEIKKGIKDVGKGVVDTITWTIKNGEKVKHVIKGVAIEAGTIYTAVKVNKLSRKIGETVQAISTLRAATQAQKAATVSATAATEAPV